MNLRVGFVLVLCVARALHQQSVRAQTSDARGGARAGHRQRRPAHVRLIAGDLVRIVTGTSAIVALWLAFCGAADAQGSSSWRDPSPHEVRFVEVEPGVSLELVDWGGSGQGEQWWTGGWAEDAS